MEENAHNKEEIMSAEETDNWFFVSAEELSSGNNKTAESNEDFSDSYSDQGSDSGSSIVVIDSEQTRAFSTSIMEGIQSIASNDNQDQMKIPEVEIVTHGLDEELIHLFDHQSEMTLSADTNEEGSNDVSLLPSVAEMDKHQHQPLIYEENASHNILHVEELFVKEGSPFENLHVSDSVGEEVKEPASLVQEVQEENSIQIDDSIAEQVVELLTQSVETVASDSNLNQIPADEEPSTVDMKASVDVDVEITQDKGELETPEKCASHQVLESPDINLDVELPSNTNLEMNQGLFGNPIHFMI